MKQLEIIGINLETGESETFFFDGDMSLLQLQDALSNGNYEYQYELDEIATLENYLDHEWLEEYELEILHDYTIMDTPLNELLDNYNIYNMV